MVADRIIEKKLHDFHDVQIFTTIYIGENKQAFEMIFDTGSNWLWIDSRKCQNCPENVDKFDERKSSTFSFDEKPGSLHYGSGSVYTYRAHDQICITREFCAEDFTFMIVLRQQNLGMIKSSGLVGMSPNHFDKESDLFIEKMKQAGAIDHAVFSLSIGMGDVQSKITFGGYDLDRLATGPIRWHNVDKNQRYWQLKLTEMKFEGKDKYPELQNQFTNKSLIIDSGTSFILIPKRDLEVFIDFINKHTGMYCEINVIPECMCTSE